MKNKFLVSTVVAASLLAPAIAFAQTSAPPDSTGPSTAQTEVTPKAMHHTMRHHARVTHMKRGTTIGMGSGARARPGGESVARKPAD